METIKIAFTDFWPEWNVEDFISPILKKYFEVIYDQKNPDVLFHSIFNRMSSTPSYKCKKILILAENWRPQRFGSNYSISFDPHSETNFRLPLWQIYWLLNPELKDRLFNRKKLDKFERFCAFVVSNPSNSYRNNAFDLLSEYKKVHAYGKERMNTLELKRFSEGKYWRDAKIDFFEQHPHKFMMAFENSSYPGYCTEKLMDAFLANTIPIYWGDPKVEEDWNPKAFINLMKHSNWIDLVKAADQEEDFWEDIYEEPVFTDEQKVRHLANIEEFENWLIEKIK